jgi:L-alanine-DL-glutamate epimerase-like enolase superfamily enzyme
MNQTASSRIERIEWGTLEAKRPRSAGSNARLGAHGDTIRMPMLRLTCADGASGFGVCRVGPPERESLLGQPFDALFDSQQGMREPWRAFDFPLWDLAGQRAAQPVYALAAGAAGKSAPAVLRVPCYDTSLYFDDLHLDSSAAAAQLIADEARAGYAQGHRAFKIKVGRGARHLPLLEGTRRDIAIIQAVRAAVGAQPPLMLDANNGYNLNLAKEVLQATADCRIYWLEEAFHEDAVLYRELKTWLAQAGLAVLIADGEGEASPRLLEWAGQGLVDVVQYDIFGHGFTRWLHTGQQLDALGVRSAPHHYGQLYGNYCAGHLAAALQHFSAVEWDAAAAPGLDASSYRIEEGRVLIPALPGFGLRLVEDEFQRAVQNGGGRLG